MLFEFVVVFYREMMRVLKFSDGKCLLNINGY